MRVVQLVALQALALGVNSQPVSDSGELLYLVVPQVRQVREWERMVRESCGGAPQTIPETLIEDEPENEPEHAPQHLDVSDHETSSLLKEQHTSRAHHTTSTKHIVQTTHRSTGGHTGPLQTASDENDQVDDHEDDGCESDEHQDEEHKADKHQDDDDRINQPNHETRSTQPNSGNDRQTAKTESNDWLTSFWQGLNLPADPRLWTPEQFLSIFNSLSSSVLLSKGLISVTKKWVGRSSTRVGGSNTTTKEHEDNSPERMHESDSSSDKQNTPTSSNSNERHSTDNSPLPALEHDHNHTMLGSSNEQNTRTTPSDTGAVSPPEPAQVLEYRSVEEQAAIGQDHDTSSHSEHSVLQEESPDHAATSPYVMVDDDRIVRDRFDFHVTGRYNNAHSVRIDRGGESVNPLHEPSIIPGYRNESSFGTKLAVDNRFAMLDSQTEAQSTELAIRDSVIDRGEPEVQANTTGDEDQIGPNTQQNSDENIAGSITSVLDFLDTIPTSQATKMLSDGWSTLETR